MPGSTIRPSTPIFFASAANRQARARGAFRDAGQHRHPAAHVLRPTALRTSSFSGVFQGAILADGAEHDHAVDAGADQRLGVLGGRGQVERLVGAELRRRRGEDAVAR